MKKKIVMLTLALALCGAGGASAQSAGQRPGSHAAAARELLESMNMRETIRSTIDAMLRVQTEGNPALAPFQDVMRTFLQKYMSWEAVGEQYVEIYTNAFTEQELHEMAAFYRTPTGRKMATLTPALSRQGAELGERTVREHMPELQQMIMERMQSMRQQGGAPRP